jgi:hypothetical protein
MGLKETLLSVSVEGYNNGLKDGKGLEQKRIIELIQDYGVKHNSHPYFLDIIKFIEGDKK